MNLKKSLLSCFALLILVLPINAYASNEGNQIDLSKWEKVTLPYTGTADSTPNWSLNSTNTSVTQKTDSRPTILLSDIECVNNGINGSFSVDSDNDDDFMGFVFGYKDSGHFYLFDWKQKDQVYSNASGKCGMSVKVASSDSAFSIQDLWGTSGSNNVKVLYHNNISYKDRTNYKFTLNFTDKGTFNIIVKDGENIIDNITINDNTYTSGKFGFYNYSQEMVTYQGFTFKELPPMLEVASIDKAKTGDEITADIIIHNATNICAEDLKIAYDTSKLQFISAENADGMKIYKEDDIAAGIKRYITACLGKANAANGDKILMKLKFKAIDVGEAKIDITNGRIADNSTLEVDVAQECCGDKIILIEGVKDVNRTGEYTLLDLGIDAWYYGVAVADTDTTKYSADQVVNGTIDDEDLYEIVAQILNNSNYPANK